MKTKEQFKLGDKVYYLDRNFPTNDGRVVEMVVRENPKTNNLELYGKQGYFTIKFDITDRFIELQNTQRKLIFKSHDEAISWYDGEIDIEVNSILSAPIHITLKELYDGWSGDHNQDYRIYRAMKQKIKNEFGVELF